MIITAVLLTKGMAGLNPLIGPNVQLFGDRFPPISNAYDLGLRLTAVECAQEINLDIKEGVYVFVCGPSFETRSEARYLQSFADCVGMSTVPEVVTAIHAGCRVLCLSLITNKVAFLPVTRAIGFSHGEVVGNGNLASHQEVLETSSLKASVFIELVKRVISKIAVA